MGNRLSKETNHLELYLNDVYRRECIFETHVADFEVEFIQTGIETLVQTIVDQVLEDLDLKKKMEKVAEELGIVLETPGPTNVIRVGSFYEGTKNKFPDEFDFTLILGCLTGDMVQHVSDFYIGCYIQTCTTITEICQRQTLVYTGSKCEENSEQQKLFFHWTVERNPAMNLKFIYQRGSEVTQPILVDLAPAVRCFIPYLTENIHNFCPFEPFYVEVKKIENILFVCCKFSIIETEVYFMRHILSKNHKKVYRVLKYIINGHGDGEILGRYIPKYGVKRVGVPLSIHNTVVYSSYMIKTMIIRHHYLCSNNNKTEIGPCILQVLNDLCKYKNIKKFPFLITSVDRFPHKFCLLPYLEHLAEYLQSMRAQNGVYDYEKERLNNSVSKQCADDHNFEFSDSDDYM